LSILAGASLMLVAAPASADVALAPMVVIDFSAFDGSGFDPEPAAGQLDSDDWSIRLGDPFDLPFGGSGGGANCPYACGLGTGSTDADGIWAFDVDGAGLIALGVKPNDSIFTPGQMVLRLVNDTGAEIDRFQVEHTVWVKNVAGRSNSLNLSASPNDVSYTQVGDDFVSPEASDMVGWVATDRVLLVVPAAPIADGNRYYIAWEGADFSGTGSRDEFGIEGITIRLLDVCGNGIIEAGEGCDDGLGNSDTGVCLTTCVAAQCGDGFLLDGFEECDDANLEAGDGCASDCSIETGETDTDTEADSSGDTAGSGDSGDTDTQGTGTGSTMTGASATTPTTTTAPTSDGSDTDNGGSGDDDDSGCGCRSSGGPAAIWGMLLLGLVRRRR
jgi:MYXO-CTERM domain-containing protein